jgi:lipopolysaccharide export system protein LptA
VKKSVFFFITILALATSATRAQQSSPPPGPPAAATGKARTAKAKKVDPKVSASPGEKNNSTDLFGSGGSDRPKGPTEITSKEQAQFDSRGRVAIFLGDVKVVDPQFTMTSDKLTAYLNKEEEGGGLKQADGEGNVTIVHLNQPKPAATPGGSPAPAATSTPTPAPAPAAGTPPTAQQPVKSTAKAERAVYVTKDGTITLTGWPQVTQGVNTHISTESGVKMIIYNDGRLQTYGSTRTIIQDRSEPNKSNPNAAH